LALEIVALPVGRDRDVLRSDRARCRRSSGSEQIEALAQLAFGFRDKGLGIFRLCRFLGLIVKSDGVGTLGSRDRRGTRILLELSRELRLIGQDVGDITRRAVLRRLILRDLFALLVLSLLALRSGTGEIRGL